MNNLILFLIVIGNFFCCQNAANNNNEYNLHKASKPYQSNQLIDNSVKAKRTSNFLETVENIPLPNNCKRKLTTGFGEYLRNLKLKDSKTVYLFNGDRKTNQKAQYAIIDMDVGKKDLQQCADAVMRLRAEYLFHHNKQNEIHFNFTSGDKCSWKYWKEGYRPVIKGNKVDFVKKAKSNSSYINFRKYLETIFTYAGTSSLSKELKRKSVENLAIGDVFIQGGFPGHAVIVIDVAESEVGERFFLLAQSYMPAQDIHVLINPKNPNLSPWYDLRVLKESKVLRTPEWVFSANDLYKF